MSTDVPKPPTKSPSGARALRLEELTALLEQPLELPDAVLETLVTAMAKGQPHPELFRALHDAAERSDKLAELAFAYEHVTADRRVKLLQAPMQAELHLNAARFFGEVFGDSDGAVKYAERALSAAPGSGEAVELIERLLRGAPDSSRLVKILVDASSAERERERQAALLARAAGHLEAAPDAHELAIDVYQRLLRVEPGAAGVRSALEARLTQAGRPRDAAKLLEAALAGDVAAVPAEDALAMRARLVSLYAGALGELPRALPHVEVLLAARPADAAALAAAEALLEHKVSAPRATAALSDAYEQLGRLPEAAAMLSRELKVVRGPRRMDVQRRLAILRQDVLGDATGALELLGPVVAADPGDDALRERYVALALELGQPQEAARLLARALTTCKAPAVRARVGADVGRVFLAAGDKRRAEAALALILDERHDDAAVLAAARLLVELHADSGDPAALAAALEHVVRLEPDPNSRHAAARRLVRMSEGEGGEPARAAVGWRALIDSPWADEALGKLEALYEASGDVEGAIEVLERRAERAKDREAGRALAFKAAELRSSRSRDRRAALGAWRGFVATYGASREAHARLAPLLEQEKEWAELVWLLERELELAPLEERAALWARIGQLRLGPLGDSAGALAAFGEALRLEPSERASRAALEKLLGAGDARLAAAAILEPLYRAEEPSTSLLRVLEARGELAPTPAERLAALGEAADTAERALGDPTRALRLAGEGLALAAGALPTEVPAWLARAQALASVVADPAARAAALAPAVEGRAVDSAALLEVARAAGEALGLAGEVPRAIEIYRAALAFEPASSELLARVDELLAQQGSPGERLALYETALAQATEPVRRRELLHATAALRRRELDDLPGAIAIWRAVLAEDPDDFAAHQALVQALGERGERDALRAELERALGRAEGERRDALRARLAEALADDGEVAGALEHYRALLEHAELDDEVLARIERLARAHGDAPSLEQVLARRLARTDAPALRAELLEEYGDVIAAAGGPDERATRAWLEGARAALGVEERERAERLYERVRAVAPSEREAPEALFELAAQSGRWARAAELFAALAPLVEPRDAASLLDGVEPAALAAGAIEAVVDMLDALATDPRVEPARGRELSLRRARALAANPARRDDAAAAFRQLIEAPGELAAAALEGFGAFLASAPERVADRRWLHERRVARAADPIGALIDWAGLEERELGAPGAALGLYRRAFELDAERADVLAEIARLEEQTGDLEAALASLEALRDRSEGEARLAAEVSRAGLLLGALGRPLDALDVLEPLIEAAPGDAALLRLAHEALGQQASRARAAALLERAAGAADDPAARARVLEALLEVSGATPELSGARVRWMKQLLEVRADAPREALALALRGALEAPAEGALWDAAERFARELDEPAPVAEAFARALERPMPPEATDELARRMIDFQEEWFDDPARVVELLGRVVELSPHADWAFDRLKLAYNAAGRWSELFALYDRALERSADERVRVELLREAAMAAKDFAADTERAIDYLERLERASPGDPRVDAALERLYERDGRYRPLIELLSRRLGGMGDAAGGELRERIAALWLELGEALPAFELLASGEAGGEASPVAVELLERLVALPASRDTVAPTSGGKRRKRNYSVRDRVAARLREHYAAVGRTADKARMLEIELEVAQNDQDRIRRLEELVTLRLDELGDEAGAFDNLAALVRLDPENRDFRARLAELARRTDDYRRYAELLTLVARGTDARALRLSLLAEAAPVVERELGDRPAAIRLYSEVLELAAKEPAEALSAARALDGLLLAAGDSAARASVLERRAELEEERELRRAALGEVARIAAEELGELDRAISAWRARLADDAADGPALDGLCRTLEAARRWPELVQALTERAARAQARSLARADRVRVAAVQAGELGKPGAAIDTWRGLRAEWGADDESFEALVGLFGRTARWDDLAELLASEAEGSLDAERRRALFERLGALHRDERGDVGAAIDAFVAAGNWERAAHVASSVGERGAARAALERVLDRAVAAWSPAPVAPSEVAPSGPGGLPETVAGAAGWALGELITRLTEEGRLADVVELELRGASLPFSVKRRRELARDAALLSADRLSAPERAIEIFTALFAEEPADEVASGSARRFVTLLEEQGRYEDVVSLWERQAECRERAGDAMGAASLWARAAALAEERLGDVERSVADHLRGAGLGGETSLEALARHHHAAGRAREEAEVLEWLAAQSSAEALAPRALALAEAYVAANSRKRARARLEEYAKVALDAAALRERLAGLYREMGDYTALALLLAAEADRAPDAPSRLALLREAARLHLERRDDPGAAVPLLEKAMELAGDGSELPLALSDALRRAARFDQAVAILREQIARYGARKPKERAVVHFALSQVWLESGSRAEALAELDLASRIDQAHPGILRALAALALEEGELERAERMYRALLLVLGRGARDDGPSRVEALLDLGRIAETKGDAVRAVEFVESAFEAALESVAEARTLEAALRRRGRRELLGRALEARLSGELEPRDAAQVLAELAALHAEQGGDQSDAKRALARRVGEVERQLGAEPGAGDEAWAALGRCYAWLGDAEAETRALERRVAGWSRDEDARPEPEVLHRLAAIKLGSAETREAGAELLERALELTGELGQAEELILAAVEAEPENERLARLLERVGRAPGRERLLLRALTLLVAFPAARAAAAREGADLARGLGEPALAESLLERALEGDGAGLAPAEAAWARLELSGLRAERGDLPGALALSERAAAELPADEARALLLKVAASRADELDDPARAIAIYERLLENDPADREAWEPLIGLLRRGAQYERLVSLIEQTVPLVESAQDRAALRALQAERLVAEDRVAEATRVLEEVLLEDPGHLESAMLLAGILERGDRTDELIALLTGQLDAAKDRQDLASLGSLSLRLGALLEQQGRPDDALDVYQSLVDWDRGSLAGARAVVRLIEARGDGFATADALEGLLAVVGPEEAPALAARLEALRLEQEDAEGAARALELGYRAAPEDLALGERLVKRYADRGDFGGVARVLRVALDAAPGDRALGARLLEAHRQAGELEEALAVVDALSDAEPDPSLLHERAALLGELGRADEALDALEGAYRAGGPYALELGEALENALAVAPSGEVTRALTLRLIDVLEQIGDLEGARARLTEWLAHAAAEPAVRRRLADLELAAGDYDAAARTLAGLVEAADGEELVGVAIELADACARADRFGDARDALERAVALVPESADARLWLRRLYELTGEHRALARMLLDEARVAVDAAARLELLLSAAGLLVSSEGGAGEALEVLDEARALSPESIEAAVLTARAFAALGRGDQAMALLGETASAHRGRRTKALASVYQEISRLQLEDGFLSDALESLSRAFDADMKNGLLALELGRLALEIDEEEIATRALRAVTMMKPWDETTLDGAGPEVKAEAHYQLAQLALKQGDARKARVMLNKALLEHPDHEAALALISQLG